MLPPLPLLFLCFPRCPTSSFSTIHNYFRFFAAVSSCKKDHQCIVFWDESVCWQHTHTHTHTHTDQAFWFAYWLFFYLFLLYFYLSSCVHTLPTQSLFRLNDSLRVAASVLFIHHFALIFVNWSTNWCFSSFVNHGDSWKWQFDKKAAALLEQNLLTTY